MTILGISAYYHDAAAALLVDGTPVAAAHEERFTRRKHDPGFPKHAVAYCLREAGLTIQDMDHVVFYEKPFVKFERILTTIIATAPKNYVQYMKAMPTWLKEKVWLPSLIRNELGYEGSLLFTSHHRSHAASAFLVSGFDEAAILTVDGVGEWETTTTGTGKGTEILLDEAIHFPHSLGLLYSAFTGYLGFKVNSGEYKVMGLAPYGKPAFEKVIREHLVREERDGSFALNQDYFAYTYGLRMINRKFEQLFGRPARDPESPIDGFHKDIAASIQVVTNDLMVAMASRVLERTGMKDLCMAGGVALNCVANEQIIRRTPVRRIFVQPAAGDAGGALGAALDIHHTVLGNQRVWKQDTVALGPSYDAESIAKELSVIGISATPLGRSELLDAVVRSIEAQQVAGWFQGRMEWGPRALGFRSILADARNPENQKRVNLKVKFRESFRPFAPAVPDEHFDDWFEGVRDPYMLVTSSVRPGRLPLPAVTHVDGSARVQSVTADQNELFHALLVRFGERTGCPVVINTSFNVRGEPIVCTPRDALRCFFHTQIDSLALGPYFLEKSNLPAIEPSVLGSLQPEPD